MAAARLDAALCKALHKASRGFFPILSIKCINPQRRKIDPVQAANVNHPGVWRNTRMTESADTAMTTRVVLCDHRAELIKSQIILAGHDLEVRVIGSVPKCSLPMAEGAIALNDVPKLRLEFERDAPAMT